MWANFFTVKMKNIDKKELCTELFKILKNDKYFGTNSVEISESKTKNQVVYSTYDGTIDERAIRKFSKKYKDEIIQVRSIRVHNPFSSRPDEPKEMSLLFYKNGIEFLEIDKGYSTKKKAKYYKIEPKYSDYKKLVIETTAGKIFDYYGNDKATIDFFKIQKKANKKEKVNIPFIELTKFERFYRGDELFLMEDIKEYNKTEISKEEFLSYFSKKELTLFSKDIN